MTLKWIGAILILVCCGGAGFSMATSHKRQERSLEALRSAIDMMVCELEFRMTPLPQLVRMASKEVDGQVADVFSALAHRLEASCDADAGVCMTQVLEDFPGLSWRLRENLEKLGRCLGRFALSGQVSGLKGISLLCQRDLNSLALDRDARLRGYRTLGICAGVALVILFL